MAMLWPETLRSDNGVRSAFAADRWSAGQWHRRQAGGLACRAEGTEAVSFVLVAFGFETMTSGRPFPEGSGRPDVIALRLGRPRVSVTQGVKVTPTAFEEPESSWQGPPMSRNQNWKYHVSPA